MSFLFGLSNSNLRWLGWRLKILEVRKGGLIIVVNSTVEVAKQIEHYFKLSLPITSEQLKKAYKRACRLYHPDLSGNEEDFKTIQALYSQLVDMGGNTDIFSDQKTMIAKTVEGIPLSELGLGLGPTTNGKDCPRCEHKGYIEEKGMSWRVCERCNSMGFVPREFLCKVCHGTSKFTQLSNRVVECRVCKGTGRYKHPYLEMPCPDCGGTKTIWGTDNAVYYRKCSHCDGTGEKPVLNPVIIKGSLNIFVEN